MFVLASEIIDYSNIGSNIKNTSSYNYNTGYCDTAYVSFLNSNTTISNVNDTFIVDDNGYVTAEINNFSTYINNVNYWMTFKGNFSYKNTASSTYTKIDGCLRFKLETPLIEQIDLLDSTSGASYSSTDFYSTDHTINELLELNINDIIFEDYNNNKNIVKYQTEYLTLCNTKINTLFYYNRSNSLWYCYLLWNDIHNKKCLIDITDYYRNGEWVKFEYLRILGYERLIIGNNKVEYSGNGTYSATQYMFQFNAPAVMNTEKICMYAQVANVKTYVAPKNETNYDFYAPYVYANTVVGRGYSILTVDVENDDPAGYSILWDTGENTRSILVNDANPTYHTVTVTNRAGTTSESISSAGDVGCGSPWYSVALSFNNEYVNWKFDFDFYATVDNDLYVLKLDVSDWQSVEIGSSWIRFDGSDYEFAPLLNEWVHCTIVFDSGELNITIKDFNKIFEDCDDLKPDYITLSFEGYGTVGASYNFMVDNLKIVKI